MASRITINSLKKEYIEYFRDVPVQKYAAEYIGRDEDTIMRWRKADKQFADAVQRAHSEWVRKTFIKTKAEFALERLEKSLFTIQPEPLKPEPVYTAHITDERGKYLSAKYMEFMMEVTKLEGFKADLEVATQYLEVNESIVDNAMQFITNPELFWNRSSTSVKQMIQLLLFPNGVVYDFETGYGTFEKLDSYLLLQKMTDKSVKVSDLVAATGIEPVTSSL